MKSTINSIKALQSELSEKTQELTKYMENTFGVDLVVSDCLIVVRNDFYSCNVWFFSRADEVKQSSCSKMPETEDEIISLFRSKATQKENITKAVEYLLEACEEEVQ